MTSRLLLFLTFLITQVLNAQVQYSYASPLAGFEYIEVVKGKDTGRLPLLIAFHYSSGTPSRTMADYDNLKNPVRIIIPKGNYRKRGGFSYFPTDYYTKDSLAQFALLESTVDSLAVFIKSIQEKYNSTAMVSGISQGGDIALLLAKDYPHLFKAAFPIAAVIHPNMIQELNHKPSNKVPVHFFQGENDPIVSLLFIRARVKEIGEKMNLKLYTYPGVGHEISNQMKRDYSRIIDSYNK